MVAHYGVFSSKQRDAGQNKPSRKGLEKLTFSSMHGTALQSVVSGQLRGLQNMVQEQEFLGSFVSKGNL